MRLVLISTVIFAVSAVQGSVLHGFKHFLLPALAPVVYPLGVIAGALWLAPRWGMRGLAAGAVIGSAFHLAIKIPGLIRHGFRWSPILDARSAAVRRVAWLVGPRVLDLGVFHLTLLATTNLASRLGAGRVSALEWGWDAMQLPETIIGTAFGLVAFPTLAELAARGDRGAFAAHPRRSDADSPGARCARGRRADRPRPAVACTALPARAVRRGCDRGSLRRAAILRAGAGRARLPGIGCARLLSRGRIP